MANTDSGLTTAKTIGFVQDMTNTSQERIDSMRNVSQRLHDLRVRLVGICDETTEEVNAPEPVRNETESLAHNLDVMHPILCDIQDDLSALERL